MMVKTPRTRHSGTAREPVTIDLQPGEVSRVKAEAEKAKAEKPEDKKPEPAAATKEQAAEPRKEQDATPSASDPKQPKKPGSTASAAGSAFARADPPGKTPEAPAAPAQRSGGGALLGGVAGGVIALLVAGGLWGAGLLPDSRPQPDDPAPAIAALEAQIADIGGQVADLGAIDDSGALAGRIAQAEERVAALAAEIESLRDAPAIDLGPLQGRVAALEARLPGDADGGAAPSQTTLAALEEQLEPLHGEIAGLREAHDAALARLDTLEAALQQLSGRVDEQAEAPSTAAIIAISAVKAAIDRGAAFTSELQTWASLAPDAPQIEALRPLAAEGVATPAELAAEADAAANAMIAASRPVDQDAGMLDKLWGSAMGLVQVRPIGMVEGEGVPEIAARIDAAVAAGDYGRAIAEFDTLPQAAKAAGEPFMAKVRARHEADRLISEALAAALKS